MPGRAAPRGGLTNLSRPQRTGARIPRMIRLILACAFALLAAPAAAQEGANVCPSAETAHALGAESMRYVGETEKSLDLVFADARVTARSAALRFDEAESLLGGRTDVRDASDRYAKQDIAYLLAYRARVHEGLRRALSGPGDRALRRRHSRRSPICREPPQPTCLLSICSRDGEAYAARAARRLIHQPKQLLNGGRAIHMSSACQQIAHQRIQRGVMTLRIGAAGRERFLIERQGDVLHHTKGVYARYVSISASRTHREVARRDCNSATQLST